LEAGGHGGTLSKYLGKVESPKATTLVPLLLSGAERNVTVQWQGEFGCLSFCLS